MGQLFHIVVAFGMNCKMMLQDSLHVLPGSSHLTFRRTCVLLGAQPSSLILVHSI